MVQRTENENITKIMSSLANFSSTAAKLGSKIKKSVDTKRENNFKNMSAEEKQQFRIAYRASKVELEKRDDFILKELKAGGLKPDALKDVQAITPGQLVRNEIYFAKEAIQHKDYSAFIYSQERGNPNFESEWNQLDPQQKSDRHRDWINEELSDFKMSKGHWAATVSDEIDRIVDTTKGTSKSKKSSVASQARSSEFSSKLAPLLDVGDSPIDGIEAVRTRIINLSTTDFKDIEGGQTAIQQATEVVVGELYDMGVSGDLSRDMLNKLIQGGGLDHPGGTTLPKAFFDKEGNMENHLLKGVQKGEAAKYAKDVLAADSSYTAAYEAVSGPNKPSQNEFNLMVARLQASPLEGKDKKIETLTNVFNNDQSKDAAIAVVEKYDKYSNLGILDTKIEELKLETNVTGRDILLEKAKRLKTEKEDAKFSDGVEALKNQIEVARTDKTLAVGSSLTVKGQQVFDDVESFRNRDFARRVEAQYATGEFIENTNLKTENIEATEAYWESNGGGTRGGAGKFSVSGKNGDFDNYGTHNDILLRTDDEHAIKYTKENGLLWDKNRKRKINSYKTKGKYDWKKRYRSPGGIFSKDQIAGTLQNGYYSEEMLYIAYLEGEPVSKLFGYAISALDKSGDKSDKNFVELMNLNEVNTKGKADQVLQDKLDEVFEPLDGETNQTYHVHDLKYLLRYKGIGDFTPNQYRRLLITLDSRSRLTEEGQQAASNYLGDKAEAQFFKGKENLKPEEEVLGDFLETGPVTLPTNVNNRTTG